MSAEYAICAFKLLFDQWDEGVITVSSNQFISDYCLPMKHVEGWVKIQIRTFGCVATQFAAFTRVCASLETDGGRQKVLVCLRERIPLAGWPPPSQQQCSAGSSTQASRYMVSGTVTARCVRVYLRGPCHACHARCNQASPPAWRAKRGSTSAGRSSLR
jgi:hypothetical protein